MLNASSGPTPAITLWIWSARPFVFSRGGRALLSFSANDNIGNSIRTERVTSRVHCVRVIRVGMRNTTQRGSFACSARLRFQPAKSLDVRIASYLSARMTAESWCNWKFWATRADALIFKWDNWESNKRVIALCQIYIGEKKGQMQIRRRTFDDV